ncbi:MAG: VCBS repeat-containing protein [Rhizobiaceae bacterium]|nr:VCBS repeat-containing protein [Rhizobiaceae bacterium]
MVLNFVGSRLLFGSFKITLDASGKRRKTVNLNKFLTLFSILMLSAFSVSAHAAGKGNKASKVDVCHFDADSGLFHVINVNSNSVDKHFANHGDAELGDFFSDTDGDGYGDALGDSDSCPNPGFVANGFDEFPDDPNEWIDSDEDGVGDNGDSFPYDPNETADTDGDGLGDNADACPTVAGDAEDGCPIPTVVLGSDLVTGNGTGGRYNQVSILLGDGNDGYSIGNYHTYQYRNHTVAVADFDKNGQDDIVIVHYGGQVWVEYNGVTNGVNLSNAGVVTGNPFQGVAAGLPTIADFNGDGWPDVAIKTFTNISVLLNDQTGGFNAEIKFPTVGEPRSLAAADLDGDGYQDIVAIGHAGHHAVAIHYGDGIDEFTTPQIIGAGDTSIGNAKLADIDGDGDIDIITGSRAGKILFYLNDGGRSFTSASLDGFGGDDSLLLVSDLNGDGAADLVTTSGFDFEVIYIWFNDGSGGFLVAPDTYSVGRRPLQAVIGDFNEDGKADIATVNGWSNDISILSGLGSGIFDNSVTVGPLPTTPESIAVGNFD